MDVRSASDCCVTVATFCLAFPTLYVSHMKNGTMKRDRTVSCHDRRSMAITVLVITTPFDRMDEAVSVTTVCSPPTSFARRDWISPVRVAVKNRSGMNWRWRYSAFRRSWKSCSFIASKSSSGSTSSGASPAPLPVPASITASDLPETTGTGPSPSSRPASA